MIENAQKNAAIYGQQWRTHSGNQLFRSCTLKTATNVMGCDSRSLSSMLGVIRLACDDVMVTFVQHEHDQ